MKSKRYTVQLVFYCLGVLYSVEHLLAPIGLGVLLSRGIYPASYRRNLKTHLLSKSFRH